MLSYTVDLEEDKETFPNERKKIKAAFDLFDRDQKGAVVKEEIGTIMRYLNAFPTEEQLVTDILPQLQDDEETQFVKFDRFEPFMVRVLVERNYEPDSEEVRACLCLPVIVVRCGHTRTSLPIGTGVDTLDSTLNDLNEPSGDLASFQSTGSGCPGIH